MQQLDLLKSRIQKAQAIKQLGEHLQKITPYHNTWNLPQRQKDECIIVASGGSIRDLHADICAYATNVDFITLNNFFNVSEFGDVKSHVHVLTDPNYFQPPQGSSTMADGVKNFMASLEKFKGPLVVAVPYIFYELAKKHYSLPNITLIGYPLERFTEIPDELRFPLADMGLVGFGGQTVTVAGIYLAIALGYKKIWIAGFDIDWFEHTYVDKHCNIRLTYDHYFTPLKEVVVSFNMVQHVESLLRTIYDSELLRAYAAWKGVQVVNLSLRSHLDIFPKGLIGKEPYPMHVQPSDPNFIKSR